MAKSHDSSPNPDELGQDSLIKQARQASLPQDFSDEPAFQQLQSQLLAGECLGNDETAATPKLADVTPRANEQRTISAGMRFGDYELVEEIGRGGMGIVFRARQRSLDRFVALKLIRSGELASEEEVQRFRAEAFAAARLDHPAIVPIYEVGEVAGQYFFSMGLVSGRTLSDRLQAGSMSIAEAVQLTAVVAHAIHYAHSRGVLHRDIKPSNILLSDHDASSTSGRGSSHSSSSGVKIADFGLAKQLHLDDDLTRTGQLLGTPRYMPPEQIRRATYVGPTADVYAIGGLLYCCLTGRPPFQAETPLETVEQVMHQEPVSPRQLNANVPRDLETICLKCLQKNPDRRYSTAALLAEDLRRFANGEPIAARPVSRLERLWAWARRRPGLATAVAAGAAVALLSLLMLLLGTQLLLTQERAKRLAATTQLQNSQLEAAQRVAQSERYAAATADYFASLGRVRQRTIERRPGWAFQNLEDLPRAAQLKTDQVDLLDIRSEAAHSLGGIDLQPYAQIPIPRGQKPHLLAFAPDGRYVAVAALGGVFELCVLVCDPADGRIVHDFRVRVTALEFDGIRHLAFLGHGEEVAVTTRSGWLHRWKLDSEKPVRKSIRMPLENQHRFVFDAPRRSAYYSRDGRIYAWRDFSRSEGEVLADMTAQDLQVTSDGRWLFVGGPNLMIDTSTRRIVHSLPEGPSRIRFSPDGRLILQTDREWFRLLDVASGASVCRLVDQSIGAVHEDHISCAQISPSGALVLSGGHDQKIKLWDVASGELLLSVFLERADEVRAVFSPDESIVAATAKGHVVLYKLNGPAIRRTVAAQAESIESFDFSEQPQMLATATRIPDAEGGMVRLWNPDSGELLDQCWHHGRRADVLKVALTPDASQLAVSNSARNRVYAWQLRPDTVRAALAGSIVEGSESVKNGEQLPVWLPLPRLIFQGASVWRVVGDDFLTDAEPLDSLGLAWDRVDAAFNVGDGRAFLFRDDEVWEFDILRNRVAPTGPRKITEVWPELSNQPVDAAMNWGIEEAYLFRGDQYARIDLARGKRTRSGSIAGKFKRWANSSNLDAVYHDSGLLNLIRSVRGQETRIDHPKREIKDETLKELYPELNDEASIDAASDLHLRSSLHYEFATEVDQRVAPRPSDLVFSPNGRSVWAVCDEMHLSSWQMSELEPHFQWRNDLLEQSVGIGAISGIDAGEDWIVAAAKGGRLLVFNANKSELHAAYVTPGRPTTVALARDETLAAYGTIDGEILILSIPDGEIVSRLEGHRDTVRAVAFTSDAGLLASGGSDERIRLWSRENGKYVEVLTLKAGAAVQTLQFSAEGHLVASVKGENALRIWRISKLREGLEALGLDW